MKRLRVPSSNAFIDDRARNPRIAAARAAPIRRPFNSTADPPFTAQQVNLRGHLSVSDSAERIVRENVGSFLDQCFHCRNRLYEGKEVYMCGDFKAFCTTECRDRQIHIDSKMEMLYNQAGGTNGDNRTVSNYKSSARSGKHESRAPLQFHI